MNELVDQNTSTTPESSQEATTQETKDYSLESLNNMSEADFEKEYDQIIASYSEERAPEKSNVSNQEQKQEDQPGSQDTNKQESDGDSAYKRFIEEKFGTHDLNQIAQKELEIAKAQKVQERLNYNQSLYEVADKELVNTWEKAKIDFERGTITADQLRSKALELKNDRETYKRGLANLNAQVHKEFNVQQQQQQQQSFEHNLTNAYNNYIKELPQRFKDAPAKVEALKTIMTELYEDAKVETSWTMEQSVARRESQIIKAYEAGVAETQKQYQVQMKQQKRAETLNIGSLRGAPGVGSSAPNITKKSVMSMSDKELQDNFSAILRIADENGGSLPE